MNFKKLIVPSLMALAVSACATMDTENENMTSELEMTSASVTAKPVYGNFGIDTPSMKTSVKPGDNFFKYVNGTWLDTTEIPADKSNYGGFGILADLSDERVRDIIEASSATTGAPGSEQQKIGDFYGAFMDEAAIEAAGLAPVQADLARIRAVQTHSQVARLMGNPEMGMSSPVAGWVDVDAKDIENYIFYITQSGLGMPNRDYYLDQGEKENAKRAAYLTFLETMLTEAGQAENAMARAAKIMAMETEMAKAHWKAEKRRNKSLTYNKMTKEELIDYAPGFAWGEMLGSAGLGDQAAFVVRENDAIKGLSRVFARTPVSVWRDYMTAHYMSGMAAYLPKSIDDADFNFYSKALRGTEVQQPRWKRAVGEIDNYMGEMVGKIYVKEHFPPESKTQMVELVENLRGAFKEGIENLEWMDPATKVEAQDKLKKFNPKIGYPNEWTDYSALKVDRNDLIGTVKSANTWGWNKMIRKLGGPIDREEWAMNPQTVNAYYRPSLNEIVFPAAILQAPFFDPNADPAVNYGGIGAVIGHEMGHGFDDQGRKTDGNGEQRDWWTDADGKAFEVRAADLETQYNEFEPLPGLNVNGKLTMGENIGDLTGITMAYAAYKRSLGGKPAPVIDGVTGDQRFFLSYSQIWKRKFREDALINRVKTDPHSPGEYRANGIVRNFDAWYDAFNVQPGDALYLPPEKRVKIW